MNDVTVHQTYVLRCWSEHTEQNEDATWRFALIDASSGDRRVFASAEEMLDALETEFVTEIDGLD